MIKSRFFSLIFFAVLLFPILLLPRILLADDINDIAYQDRFLLKAGTVLNNEGQGDCLIFPYYDARTIDGKIQITQINIENFGENGIAAKLRFREGSRGREVFSKDIWIPSAGAWNGKIESNEDGTNAMITSFDNVILHNDKNSFYLSNPLAGGTLFSTRNILGIKGGSTLYGYFEVIGEEMTSDNIDGKVGRLATIERDCPNTLRGKAFIQRVDDGVSMAYDAVAIGNFSRGQGSLFRSPGSPYPRLDNCEDTLDQLEFQLSKWEVFGPYSVSPSNQGKTSLIITFPTKLFHYQSGNRVNQIDNPFESAREATGETLKTGLSKDGNELPADSIVTLPFSVNVIGLYKDYFGSPMGIDNVSMPTFTYESGEIKLTSDNLAERALIDDFEYLQERFTMYGGLPAVGLVLQEYRDPDQLHASITPVEFSTDWLPSNLESVLIPATPSGPTLVTVGQSYTFSTGGSASSLGNPIQYLIDWGDGTNSGWLAVGTTSASKTWTTGGVFTVRARARSSIHTDIVSNWSNGLVVAADLVSAPTVLNGPITGIPNTTYTYSTGGATSNLGNPVQYFFGWGDGTDSNWLPVGVTTATKSWPTGGTYNVTAMARDAINTSVVSSSTTLVVNIELISTPTTPVGPVKGIPGDTFTYITGGASSNINDPIEYQFDWAGDGSDLSPWQSSTTFTKTWTKGGTFQVKARARDAIYTSVMSAWSGALTVNIDQITAPTKPTQEPTGVAVPGLTVTYTTGGATSNIGDPVQYFIDFGDGTSSGWLPVGTTSYSKSWFSGGTFNVRAKARDAIHTQIESDWSQTLQVQVETITTPNAPSGPTPVSLIVNPKNTYTVSGAVSNLGHAVQYFIDWGDNTNTGWLAAGTTTADKTWTAEGTYLVTVRARCSVDNQALSGWSAPLSVTVNP